ncbi:MAG: DNA recombination protein RmuC, partial [Parvibaculaceae bacterium]|nr:DNA recombination protein RmuC [Parvibaculaceae bacterium]
MIATAAPSGSLDLLLVLLAIGGTLLALGLGVVLARFLMQPAVVEDEAGDRRQEMLEIELARLLKNQEELKGRLSGIGENQVQQSQAINKTLNERLDGVSQRLSNNMTEQTKKTAESLGKLNERLSVIDEAQKNLTGLSTEFLKLQDILNNKQARGAFGEIQLNDLVTNALPPSAYSFQTTLGNGKRADCIVLLPNPPGPIVIDAKFPLDAYHAL